MKKEQTPEIDTKVYNRERAALIKSEQQAVNQFDKLLILISTGSLYFSFYFLKDIKEIQSSGFLIAGWIFLIFSIVTILLSFLLSEQAFRKQREILDKQYGNAKEEKNTYNKWIRCVQIISFITLILGVIFLTLFYFFNL